MRRAIFASNRHPLRTALAIAGLAVAGIACSAPALADVKAGVDAWSTGDFATAAREWQAAADKGDPDGEFNLAQAYKLGRGVPQDLTRAEALYAKAAARGHVQAGDNLGLLMFQRGDHAGAMPYLHAAADHGDPRAQYLLGIAMFNGDQTQKDWIRAYALVSLAQQNGLPQAAAALAQMDKYIPIDQRQRAVAVATEMASQAEASRNRQMTAMDLGTQLPPAGTRMAAATPPMPRGMAGGHVGSAPTGATPPRTGYGSGPAPAPARGYLPEPQAERLPTPRPFAPAPPSYLTPHMPPAPAPTGKAPPAAPVRTLAAPSRLAAPAPAPKPRATAIGAGSGWRIQLGAFGVAANADAQWARVRARPEVAGHPRIDAKAGAVTRLMAGGYGEDGAHAACRALTGAGMACIATRD